MAMTDEISGRSAARAVADPRRWIAMTILFVGLIMNVMDVTIVNVALPAMQTGLGATPTQVEWISAIFILAFAIGLLPMGRLGDIFGRKTIFLGGVAAFTVTSALCGLAPSVETLIGARLLQGIAGAMMVPQVLAIIAVIFPPEEKGRAFALFGVVGSLGAIAGPLVGGGIIAADIFGLGWRPTFLVNVPVGIAIFLSGIVLIPGTGANKKLKLDPVGIVLFGLATLLLVFPLIEGRMLGWPWWILAMLASAVPTAIAFWSWERRQARLHRAELLPASLLGRDFVIGVGTVMLFFSGIPGFFLILALVLQSGHGLDALQSGLATLPFPVGFMIASLLSGRLGAGYLRARVGVGALLVALGMGYLRFTLAGLDAALTTWSLLLPLSIAGVGMGLGVPALFQSVMRGVPPADAGAGAGAMQAFQHAGGALGIAIAGQVFFASLDGRTAGAAFSAAAANATWYPTAVFGLVAALSLYAAWRSGPGGRIAANPH